MSSSSEKVLENRLTVSALPSLLRPSVNATPSSTDQLGDAHVGSPVTVRRGSFGSNNDRPAADLGFVACVPLGGSHEDPDMYENNAEIDANDTALDRIRIAPSPTSIGRRVDIRAWQELSAHVEIPPRTSSLASAAQYTEFGAPEDSPAVSPNHPSASTVGPDSPRINPGGVTTYRHSSAGSTPVPPGSPHQNAAGETLYLQRDSDTSSQLPPPLPRPAIRSPVPSESVSEPRPRRVHMMDDPVFLTQLGDVLGNLHSTTDHISRRDVSRPATPFFPQAGEPRRHRHRPSGSASGSIRGGLEVRARMQDETIAWLRADVERLNAELAVQTITNEQRTGSRQTLDEANEKMWQEKWRRRQEEFERQRKQLNKRIKEMQDKHKEEIACLRSKIERENREMSNSVMNETDAYRAYAKQASEILEKTQMKLQNALDVATDHKGKSISHTLQTAWQNVKTVPSALKTRKSMVAEGNRHGLGWSEARHTLRRFKSFSTRPQATAETAGVEMHPLPSVGTGAPRNINVQAPDSLIAGPEYDLAEEDDQDVRPTSETPVQGETSVARKFDRLEKLLTQDADWLRRRIDSLRPLLDRANVTRARRAANSVE